MDPVTETPTEARDYALLSSLYGAILGGVALTARDREPIRNAELVPLAAATFALSKLVVKEKVETWVRTPFVDESPNGRRPKGRRMRYAIGELLTCTRCTGGWAALGLVGLRLQAPATGRTVTTVLAASAGSDFLHAAFSWLCARADTQAHDAGESGVRLERLTAAARPAS
jgi:Protein of unknown function (DUF1360)